MSNLEEKLQEACVLYFRYQYPNTIIHHSKNEGNRKSIVMKRNGKSYSPDGSRNKAMGVYAGFADLQIVCAKSVSQYEENREGRKPYHGLFIEIKTPTGRQSDVQKAFEKQVIDEGYQYRIVRSVDEFMDVVNEYMK